MSESLFRPIGEQVADVAGAGAAAADGDAAAVSAGGAGGDDGDLGAPTASSLAGDVMTLSSLCMGCEEQGETKLLLTRIPFFRDVILMAFECEHCGLRNSELQSAEVQEKGCRFEVVIKTQAVRGGRACGGEG